MKMASYVKVAVLLLVAMIATVQSKEIRLIETEPGKTMWMTEDEVLNLIKKDTKFMDITDHQRLDLNRRVPQSLAIPTTPTNQRIVTPLLSQINLRNLQQNLNTFSTFNNRYYTSTTGEQSSNWLFQTVKATAGNRSEIVVTQFQHSWLQKSVVARIPGSSGREDIVVIGAHQDSINLLAPVNGRAPGADDDGSGSITLLEIFRILIDNGFRPELTVEFHWYSAEEVGLRGSQDIVSSLVARNVPVRSMVQIDMDGYNALERKVAIITDFTDSNLNAFLRKLVEEYCTIGWVDSQCGYACSDHGSFNKVGYPASFPFESQFKNINPFIHTTQDTIEKVSFEHMAEFAKLGLSYIIETSFNN